MSAAHDDLATGLRWEEIPTPVAPADLLAALSEHPHAALLDSSAVDDRFGRYSLVACRPAEIVVVRDGRVLDRQGRQVPGSTVIDALRTVLGRWRASGLLPTPYGPGWIGYVGYEFGRYLERLPGRAVRDTSLPDLHLAFYDAVAVHDAIEKRWHLTWLDSSPTGAREVLREMLLAGEARPHGEAADAPGQDRLERGVHADRATGRRTPKGNFTKEQYLQAVRRCIEYIAAGDIFQANLSQRFTVKSPPAPLRMYQALRRRNPACYSAYLSIGDSAILSSSPELFLRLRGRDVLTRPIKGTRRRTGDPAVDAQAAEELTGSSKDNAELAMIVDLLRNDLGRICRYGSVRVANPRELEAHPTVFHLVGSVVGRLREGSDALDLLTATFPGGSITGAPKIRAMEIIDELEGLARGVYTGSIGYIGANGDAELNIAIRTIVYDRGRAHVQVGGGIVADSTPEGEYQETLDKARALLEAIDMARRSDTA
jgi:para-aminobenzoate synthetase component 1